MRVILFRHGIAIDRDDPDCPTETERYLTKEGREKTREAAKGLRKLGVKPGAILSSPYVRAMQTAEIVAEVLKRSVEKSDTLIPPANPEEIAAALRERSGDEVICVGHEPHLSSALAMLVWGERGGPTFAGLKKAGAACIETEEPGRSPGELLWILPPRVLRRLGDAG